MPHCCLGLIYGVTSSRRTPFMETRLLQQQQHHLLRLDSRWYCFLLLLLVLSEDGFVVAVASAQTRKKKKMRMWLDPAVPSSVTLVSLLLLAFLCPSLPVSVAGAGAHGPSSAPLLGASSHPLKVHLASTPSQQTSKGHHFVPFGHSPQGRGSSTASRHLTPSRGSPAYPPQIMPATQAGSMPRRPILAPSEPPSLSKPSLGSSPVPATAPAFSPNYRGSVANPISSNSRPSIPPKQYKLPHMVSPTAITPSPDKGCDQTSCSDPLTSTPIGSPCGCVLPMQVELTLGVAPYAVFPLVAELEIEVAAGTYLKQSQVRIMGATADSQDQGKTVVNIDLVPLGEKFDNTSALLMYEKFWQKKVAINTTLFSDYRVIYVHYPGLPTSQPSTTGNSPMGMAPRGNGNGDPFGAKVVSRSKNMNARTIAVIILGSFVLFLICFGALWFLLLKCKKLGGPSTAVGPAFTSSITKRSGIRSMLSSSMGSSTSLSMVSNIAAYMLSVKTFSLAELQKATDKFSFKRFLGEGGFGRVYHGIMDNGSEVAVKLLTREDTNGDREFIAEVEMLSRLHHRNLVKLIGICIEDQTRCLVYELVRNGSVESHLHGADKKSAPLDWDARMKIALGAARGLAYLHEDSNPRVIHRDFKASNVLLEDDFNPKVSDFGLAREASEGSQHISTRVMGTFGYVAPEYAMTGHLLVKSDVYSYGVMLLELLSGRKPVDMSQPPGQENLVTWARPLLTTREGLEKLVDPSLAAGGNTNCYDFDNMARVAAIASMCVHPEVSQRPFMGEVVQALKLVYNDDTDETCGDSYSQRGEESSGPDCDYLYRGERERELAGLGDRNWCSTTPPPCFRYGYTSSFITMDYSSGPLDETNRRPPLSASSTLVPGGHMWHGGDRSPLTMHNRSAPPRAIRFNKPAFYRLRGSMSEHGLLGKNIGMDRYWF